MFKKLFLIVVLLLSPTVGYTAAFAETTPENGSITVTEDNRSADLPKEKEVTIEQIGQAANSSDDQNKSKITQTQTTVPSVTQNQDVKGDPAAQQTEDANVVVCQQQTTVITAVCQEENAGSNEKLANQSQSAGIDAIQTQDVSSAGSADVNQDQETDLKSNQSQGILLPSGADLLQTQGTGILTDQVQSSITNAQSIIFQGQFVKILNSQDQKLYGAGAIFDEQKQGAVIDAIQFQHLKTSDSAKMSQTQEADIQSEITDTGKNNAGAGVNIKTRNYLEFIKDTSANMVHLVQEIIINGLLVDSVDQEYSLNDGNSNVSPAERTFQKQYDWGNLLITNHAEFFFNEELQNLEAKLTNTLSLILNGSLFRETNEEIPKDQNNGDGSTPDNEDETSDSANNSSQPSVDGNTSQTPGEQTSSITSEVTQVSKQEITEVPAASVKEQETSADAEMDVTENGKQLPMTSTNSTNILLLGILSLAAGFGLLIRRNKKQN